MRRCLARPITAVGWWRRSEAAKVTRRYRPHTLILETHFETEHGAATVVDFMPFGADNSTIVRFVIGKRGKVAMHTELILRFGYGGIVPWVTRLESGALRAIAGPDMVLLHTPVHVSGKDMTTVGDFTIARGETIPFLLTYSPSHLPAPQPVDPTNALAETETYWREWSAKCRPAGRWTEAVKRSVITLKALTYAADRRHRRRADDVVAGAHRRQAQLGLPLLLAARRHSDAARLDACRLLRRGAGLARMAVARDRRQPGSAADHVRHRRRAAARRMGGRLAARATRNPRRCASATRRIPNLQLDVFGEIMDTYHQARRGGLTSDESGWAIQIEFLKHLKNIWRQPDQGIWEMRGPPQHFTYSKVMAWVAFDRAIKSAETFGLEGPIDDWRTLRDEICKEVCERAYQHEARHRSCSPTGPTSLTPTCCSFPASAFCR